MISLARFKNRDENDNYPTFFMRYQGVILKSITENLTRADCKNYLRSESQLRGDLVD